MLQRARHLGAVGLPQQWNLGVGFPSEDRNESKGLLLSRGHGLAWDLCLRPQDPGCRPDLGETLPPALVANSAAQRASSEAKSWCWRLSES